MNKFKYHILGALVFLGTSILGIVAYGFDWSGITTVKTGDTLSASIWNDTINNIKNNLEELSSRPGTIANVVTVQTRDNTIFTAPITGNGTEVTPLRLSITPKKAGNKVILEWIVNGEMNNNTVYIVTRNGVLLTDTTDASNNRWAGVTAQTYDTDTNSTPDNTIVKIIDNNSLNTASTYEIRVRASSASAYSLYLNRTVGSAGTDRYETSLSTGIATEIWQ
ncbi:MAG: hypothetical protein PHG82_00355 [Candidatus Gracilibacteria bacterium]|nr:hypothetical protein [Candidatus Gracilibacteria bacterium]